MICEVVNTHSGPACVQSGTMLITAGAFLGSFVLGFLLLLVQSRFNPRVSPTTMFIIFAGFILFFPLFLEDTSGLVFLDTQVWLDHLAAIGTLIMLKVLWNINKGLKAQLDEPIGKE